MRKKLSRQAEWQRKKLKAGRCRTCGAPRSKKSTIYCPAHLRRDRERKREQGGFKARVK